MSDLIYLVGYRGVGKSTLGRMLAKNLGYAFFDTDDAVIAEKKADIGEIVCTEGWQEFRRCEEKIVRATRAMRRTVVATGGGAVLHLQIWENMPDWSYVFWLTAADTVILQRIAMDVSAKRRRPSLTGAAPADDARRVLQERIPLYRRIADAVVDTGHLSREEAVAQMILAVGTGK